VKKNVLINQAEELYFLQEYTSAILVVIHALWQKSCHRNPSLTYGGERNPRKALALAKLELGEYEAICGDCVGNAAEKIIWLASLIGQKCRCIFNGVELVAIPGITTKESLLEFFDQECRRLGEEYEKSPAGIKAAAKAEANRVAMQEQMDKAMAELQILDSANLEKVISWVELAVEPLDHIDVIKDDLKVIGDLSVHGFNADVNCGADFNENDEKNVAYYIVGQLLAFLAYGHGVNVSVVLRFCDEWREKFNHPKSLLGKYPVLGGLDFIVAVLPPDLCEDGANCELEDANGDWLPEVTILEIEGEDRIPSPLGLSLNVNGVSNVTRETDGWFLEFLGGPEGFRYIMLESRRDMLRKIEKYVCRISDEFRNAFLTVLLSNCFEAIEKYGNRAALIIW
jgi:hypothetical protein